MREKRLTIQIKKPVNEVFDFLLNPNNTSLWTESVVKEETSEWPVKVGTLYRNHGQDGVWNQFILAELTPNKSFELKKIDKNYHVRYTFKELPNNETEFEYFEWVEQGELEDPFTQEILEKLKTVMEAK